MGHFIHLNSECSLWLSHATRPCYWVAFCTDHPHNGPPISYPAPMGHYRQPVPSYGYESSPGYVAMPPPISAPSLQGRPQFAPYNAAPTAPQYGCNQPYPPPPVVYNHPRQQSNSYERTIHGI